MEIDGDVDAKASFVTLPVKQIKTEKQFNSHRFECGDSIATGVKHEVVANVEVPLQFCQKAKPLPDGWPGSMKEGSFVFDIAGRNTTFTGSCSAYIHPRTNQMNYIILLRSHW